MDKLILLVTVLVVVWLGRADADCPAPVQSACVSTQLELDCGLVGKAQNALALLEAQHPTCWVALQGETVAASPATVLCPNEGTTSSVTFSFPDCTFSVSVANVVYTCDPCPEEAPDVLLTSGSGASPPNALWRLPGFAPGFALAPEFLCTLATVSAVADVAWLASGDVIIMDVQGRIYYMSEADYNSLVANTAYDTTPCPLTLLLMLDGGWTGLGTTFKEDQLIASSGTGLVATLQFYVEDNAPKMRVLSSLIVPPSPNNQALTNSGGTDICAGPDGRMHRFVAQDGGMAFSAASFGVDPTTLQLDGTSYYSNRMLDDASAAWRNAGAFCTRTMAVGCTSSGGTTAGHRGAFWEMGLVEPDSVNPNLLPPIVQVGQTIDLGANRLRINGAANKPICSAVESTCSVPAACTNLQLSCGQVGQTDQLVEELMIAQAPTCMAALAGESISVSPSRVECPVLEGESVEVTVTITFEAACSFTVDVVKVEGLCSPCPDANPDVLMTSGQNSLIPNGLWRIRGWAANDNNVPELLCQLVGSAAMIGDIAWLENGGLVAVNVRGQLFYVPGDVINSLVPTPAPYTDRVQCTLTPLGSLPGTGWTGLGHGVKENQLIASKADGTVLFIRLGTDGQGGITEVTLDSHVLNPSPMVTAGNSGGTDITYGSGGSPAFYRWVAKDANMPYSVSVLPIDPVTKLIDDANVGYSGFQMAGTTEAHWQNAGTFCTDSLVVGATSTSSAHPDGAGRFAAFWAMPTTTADPQSLPQITRVGRTTILTGDWMRVNGAANKPSCG